MMKKLLTLILSVMMIFTVTQTKIYAATPIESIDFGDDFLLENLEDFYDNTCTYCDIISEKMSALYDDEQFLPHINKPSYICNVIDFSERIVYDSSLIRGESYYLRLKLSSEPYYNFGKETSYYLKNIHPTPNRVEINESKSEITIYFLYKEGVLDSGGGSSDAIDEIDLTGQLPDFSGYGNKTVSALTGDIMTEGFDDYNIYFAAVADTTDGLSPMQDSDKLVSGRNYLLNMILVIKAEGASFACDQDCKYTGTILPEPSNIMSNHMVGEAQYDPQSGPHIVSNYSDTNKKNAINCICFDFTVDGGESSDGIDAIDLTDALPNDYRMYNSYTVSDFISELSGYTFGDLDLYANGIVCYKMVLDGNYYEEELLYGTDILKSGEEYRLYLYLNAPTGNTFACKWDETLEKFVYDGTCAPATFNSKPSVGELYEVVTGIPGINSSENTPSKNGIMLVYRFNVDDNPNNIVDEIDVSDYLPVYDNNSNKTCSAMLDDIGTDFGDFVVPFSYIYNITDNCQMGLNENFDIDKQYRLILYLTLKDENKILSYNDSATYTGTFLPKASFDIHVGEISTTESGDYILTADPVGKHNSFIAAFDFFGSEEKDPIIVEADKLNFQEKLLEAKQTHEEDPTVPYIIELTEDIGTSDNPLQNLETDPNTNIDLNGHDMYIEGNATFFGDIEDNGEGEKGKLYLENADDLINNSSPFEADDDNDTRQELVWEEIQTGKYAGWYCLYDVGAQTKWANTETGMWTTGQDKAKFKIQPNAYDDLHNKITEGYGNIFGDGTKIKVGIDLKLYRNNSTNPATFSFPFEDSLTDEWASEDTPLTKCISVNISGLKSYNSISARATIYSKPGAYDNSKFLSNYKVAGNN